MVAATTKEHEIEFKQAKLCINLNKEIRKGVASPTLASSVSTATNPLSSLISLQKADGLWKLDDAIANILSKSLKKLSDACPVKCDGGVATLYLAGAEVSIPKGWMGAVPWRQSCGLMVSPFLLEQWKEQLYAKKIIA